jgi:hypothetical protein
MPSINLEKQTIFKTKQLKMGLSMTIVRLTLNLDKHYEENNSYTQDSEWQTQGFFSFLFLFLFFLFYFFFFISFFFFNFFYFYFFLKSIITLASLELFFFYFFLKSIITLASLEFSIITLASLELSVSISD